MKKITLLLASILLCSSAFAVTSEEEARAKETGKAIMLSIAEYCKSLKLSDEATKECFAQHLDEIIAKVEAEIEKQAIGK